MYYHSDLLILFFIIHNLIYYLLTSCNFKISIYSILIEFYISINFKISIKMRNGYQLQFSINRVFHVEKFVAEPVLSMLE